MMALYVPTNTPSIPERAATSASLESVRVCSGAFSTPGNLKLFPSACVWMVPGTYNQDSE